MRVTLLHNPKAGTAASEEALRSGFDRIGWKVGRAIPKQELDRDFDYLEERDKSDVVVVAGGDGTVSKVAKRLAGTGVPIAIVPMGVANNIARSLGIGVDPLAAIAGLGRATERKVDLGVATSDAMAQFFVEGFGVGAFAHVVAERASKKTKKLRRAWSLMADELDDYTPRRFDLEVDGRDRSGRYILAAVMNGRSLGPALGLAPHAKCDDGQLDVVLVPPEAKQAFVRHLRRAAEAGDVALPDFETTQAEHVSLRADGRWAHLDDAAFALEGRVTIDVARGAVRLLMPSLEPVRS
jgi:diacylglycerol kinase family enzyme